MERTTLGLNGSTDPAVSTTAPAPAASAARSTVPALPGSCTRHSTAASAAPSKTCASGGCSGMRATATIPCPVTASAMAVSTSSEASRTNTRSPPPGPPSATRSTRAASSESRSASPAET